MNLHFMVKIKIFTVYHASETYAIQTIEKEITHFIENEIPNQNGVLIDVNIQSGTAKNIIFIIAIIKYEANIILGSKNEEVLLLLALEQMIRKKPHYLPNIKEGDGVEHAFYGELINLGYHRKPTKCKYDFEEFEVKAITSHDLRSRVKDGFKQHNKVLAIIAATEKNLQALEKLKTEYKINQGNVVQLPEGNGLINKWLAAIFSRI
jgi:hypothetical protein